MSPDDLALLELAQAAMADIIANVMLGVRRGQVSLVAALAGTRMAGMTMQASAENAGHDCSGVERALDLYVAAMEAGTIKRGDMQ